MADKWFAQMKHAESGLNDAAQAGSG